MKYLFIFLIIPFSASADERYCSKLADIVMTQAIGKAYVNESLKDSSIEQWRMSWFLSAEDFNKLGVSERRQKKISKEIAKVKSISGDSDSDAFIIADFYYAHCITPKKKRKYKSLLKASTEELNKCWRERDQSKEHGARLCITSISSKP